MILRRISEGIRQQDWFVVGVEILTVVVGIFIGLQVDDWNEARKDRVLEREYLERLATDLEADLEQFGHGIRLNTERQELGELLMLSVGDSSVVERDPALFVRALSHAGFTFSPSISDHTFEEIKSSGKLALIRDVYIRSNLTRYYTAIRSSDQWGYLREQNQTEYIERSRGILEYDQERLFWGFQSDVQVSKEEAMAAYERMLASDDFLEWLPVVTIREMGLRNYQNWSGAASNLLDAIRQSLAEDKR